MTHRCIVIPAGGTRCPRRASRRAGDIFTCVEHSTLIRMALLDDMLAPATRRMLTHASWETRAAGQRLIDQMYRRRAA